MGSDVSVGLAFIAGILSFISPCVLPLIPAYISYLTVRASGQSIAELRMAGGPSAVKVSRAAVLLHGAFFVLGFTLVFVGFGMILSIGVGLLSQNAALGSVQDSARDVRNVLAKGGGIVVILFGLHVLGLTNLAITRIVKLAPNSGLSKLLQRIQGFLYMDTRREMNPNASYGYFGSAAMGMFFAAGWSPCIGPILGGILTMAVSATTGSVWLNAGGLLLVYSMGLGVPFMLSALAIDQMRGVLKRVQRYMRVIETVSGIFLILVGVLLYTGELERLANAGGGVADFTYNLQECTLGGLGGTIPWSDFNTCMTLGPNYKFRLEEQQKTPAGESATPGPTQTSTPGPTPVAENNPMLPAFNLKMLDGTPVSAETLRGRVALINIWATWCGPCRAEMPDFQRLAEKYGPEGFVLVAVNYGELRPVIEAFLKDNQLDIPVALDERGSLYYQLGAPGLPTSLVVGRDGRILLTQTGPFDIPALESALQAWLKG